MQGAIRLAEVIRREYGIRGLATQDEVDRIAHEQGFNVWHEAGLTGPVKGFRLFELIATAKGLANGGRLAVTCHELGHALLHTSNAMYVEQTSRRMLADKQEQEAQVFAMVLLLGPLDEGFDGRMHDAYDNGVPMEFLCSGINALLVEHGGYITLTASD